MRTTLAASLPASAWEPHQKTAEAGFVGRQTEYVLIRPTHESAVNIWYFTI